MKEGACTEENWERKIIPRKILSRKNTTKETVGAEREDRAQFYERGPLPPLLGGLSMGIAENVRSYHRGKAKQRLPRAGRSFLWSRGADPKAGENFGGGGGNEKNQCPLISKKKRTGGGGPKGCSAT